MKQICIYYTQLLDVYCWKYLEAKLEANVGLDIKRKVKIIVRFLDDNS